MITANPGSPTVVAADPRTDPLWHTLAATAQGSLFTSPPWIRSVCDTYGFTPQARIVTDAAGRPTDGFAWVPISDIRGDRLVSLPFSDRAEPLVADPATWSSLVDDALRTDAPLKIRCLDAAVPTADARLVRAGRPLGTAHRWVPPCRRSTGHSAPAPGGTSPQPTGTACMSTRSSGWTASVSITGCMYHFASTSIGYWPSRCPYSSGSGRSSPFMTASSLSWRMSTANRLRARSTSHGTTRCTTSSGPRSPAPCHCGPTMRWPGPHCAGRPSGGSALLDWGLSDLDQPGLVAYKRKWASQERRIVTLRSMSRDPNNHRDPGQLLGELTRLLTEDAVPDHITERAGSLLYRYFA